MEIQPFKPAILDPSVFDILFLGTGTSGGVPMISCLTGGNEDGNGGRNQCQVCLSTLEPAGRKSRRMNVSTVIRYKGTTLLIDCGKTFYNSCIEVLPQNGVRKLDGVLITHEHADACNGIDDLRHWTLNANIQGHLDIYSDQATFDKMSKAFTYLTDAGYAQTGNSVADLRFHIIDGTVPFKIGEIDITPFYVGHGYAGEKINDCLGFLFPQKLLYISDTHKIPENVWDMLENTNKKAKIAVLDLLMFNETKSHFGIAGMLDAAKRYGAEVTAVVGMGHQVEHDDLKNILQQIELGEQSQLKIHSLLGATSYKSTKVRPAWDGCRLAIDDDGSIKYDEDFI